MRTWTIRGCAAFLCILCLLVLLPVRAAAAGAIDGKRDVTLRIAYRHNGEPVASARFELYHVASVDAYANFTLAGDFAGYPVRLDCETSAEWTALAETLAAYAARDGLSPLDTGKTDENGTLTFPNEQARLAPGLYLVVGQTLTANGYTYEAEPFLVSLPGLENDAWVYDVTASPKHTRTENPPAPSDDTVDRRVIKLWQDDVAELRPSSVVIELLKDGRVYDTVTLNEKNTWRYTWEDLPKYNADGSKIDWRVTEQLPKNYTVRIARDGAAFLVTNTYRPERPDGDTVSRTLIKRWMDAGYEQKRPDSVTVTLLKDGAAYEKQTITRAENWQYTWHDLPRYNPDGTEIVWALEEAPVSGYAASVQQSGDTFLLTNTLDRQKLPQTGLLWWPVPVLAAMGLALLILGAVSKRKNGHD